MKIIQNRICKQKAIPLEKLGVEGRTSGRHPTVSLQIPHLVLQSTEWLNLKSVLQANGVRFIVLANWFVANK